MKLTVNRNNVEELVALKLLNYDRRDTPLFGVGLYSAGLQEISLLHVFVSLLAQLISKVSCENVELIYDESLKTLAGKETGVCLGITVLDWAQTGINRISVLYFTLLYSYIASHLLLVVSHNINTAIYTIIVQNALNVI